MKSKTFRAVIVIFGATGDLTRRKLIPALYKLFASGQINEDDAILCIGRRSFDAEGVWAELATDRYIAHADGQKIAAFRRLVHYLTLDFSGCDHRDCASCQSCRKLADKIAACEQGNPAHRFFYLATPPTMFESLASVIKECGLLAGQGERRVAFEKPFGHDLASASELNRFLAARFEERQIFRIDHYLGKALVQDLVSFRFANGMFYQLWNRNFIDNIQITVAESLGVENRAAYYDSAGAMRDMLQNHLMQLFALTAMEMPRSLDAEAIRDEKTRVIRLLYPPSSEDLVLGQYGSGMLKEGGLVPAYTEEKGIVPQSRTETYVALRAFVDSERWQGVPFYLRTGKRLAGSFAEINVQFKEAPTQLFGGRGSLRQNLISIRIQPDTGISMTFNTQKPDDDHEIVPVTMDFCHHCLFAINTLEAYEALFLGLFKDDRSMFTRWDTTQASWEYVDKLSALQACRERPSIYPAGSLGPRQADDLLAADGRGWLNHSFSHSYL